jgi:hypothetical protein
MKCYAASQITIQFLLNFCGGLTTSNNFFGGRVVIIQSFCLYKIKMELIDFINGLKPMCLVLSAFRSGIPCLSSVKIYFLNLHLRRAVPLFISVVLSLRDQAFYHYQQHFYFSFSLILIK